MMTQARDIPDRLQNPFLTQIKSWETLLLAVAIGRYLANSLNTITNKLNTYVIEHNK